jgi:uncharacterized protein (DUF2235 family)
MTRQLVVCLDGTGNRFSHKPTNVIRILRALNADLNQVLPYYDQGVGTFGIKETLFEWQKVPSRIFGLAFGWGMSRTVESAYRFLAENYREGDDLYLFGFSRGAYTVRALAALVYACGLVQPHQLNLFEYAWAMLLARDRKTKAPDFALQRHFKNTFGRSVSIKFLGLFDTVKSVGWVYDPTAIPYTAKNPIVKKVRHAQSIDERRCFFRQNSWSDDPTQKTDVKQVWFAGVHSDIGGGYDPETSQLSSVALCWMLGEAIADGLDVDRTRCLSEMQLPEGLPPDLTADMHDSMTKGWKFAEWVPQYVWTSVDFKRHFHIGAMPPFGRPRSRVLPSHPAIHVSVKKRLDERPEYRPQNLQQPYDVVNDDTKSPCT